MRTTIELTDEQRAKLLHEAARRGKKGFSSIIQEAIDEYFAADADRVARRAMADRLIGALSDEEAERIKEDIRALRRAWR